MRTFGRRRRLRTPEVGENAWAERCGADTLVCSAETLLGAFPAWNQAAESAQKSLGAADKSVCATSSGVRKLQFSLRPLEVIGMFRLVEENA